MTVYLPWIALAVALAALVLKEKPTGESAPMRPPAGAYLVLTAVVVLSMLAAWKYDSAFDGLLSSVTGFAIGCALSAVAYALRLVAGVSTTGRALPIALAVSAVAFVDWLLPGQGLSLVFGAAVSAWLLCINRPEEPNVAAISAAVASAAIVATNLLGGVLEEAAQAGVVLGLLAAVVGIISPFITRVAQKTKTEESAFNLPFAIILMLGGAFLIAHKLFFAEAEGMPIGPMELTFGGSAVIALAVHWMLLDKTSVPTIRLALAAIIWVSTATVAFAVYKGFGMALSFLGALSVLLLAGNRQALLTLGPLAVLVLYRVFREQHVEATRAFDIGQHYAMIGLLVGAVLPIICGEWLLGSGIKPRPGRLLAGAVWILILAATPIAAAILLGAKGVIGYVVGLGLAPVMEAIRGERSGHTLSLSLGLAAAMTLAYGWLEPYVELTREEKVVALSWMGGLILVAALVVAILSFGLERARTEVKETA